MKSKQEIKKWLLDNAVNEYGDLDLSDLDFSDFDGSLDFGNIKSKGNILNSSQKSKGYIDNSSQKSDGSINNAYQQSDGNINNASQKSDGYIDNASQQSNGYIYNTYQQSNGYIDNAYQQSDASIHNYNQKSESNYCNNYAIYKGKEYKVDTTDNVYLMIEKSQTFKGITIIEGIAINDDKIFLYKNNYISFHAYTKQEAKEGFKRKLKGFELNQERINQIKEQGYITRKDYRELTGACYPGIQSFAERIGKPNEDKLKLDELKEYLNANDYGYDQVMKWLGDLK